MIPERDSAIRGVWTFLLIAFGLGWAAQIIVARMLLTVDGTMAALGGGIFIAAVALMWPPAVGAFVARRWVEKSGFDDAGLRRPRTRAVLIAWFGPPALVMIALLLSLPVYPFDARFQALAESAEQAGQPLPVAPGILVLVQIAFALTLAVPINAIFAFGEEFGWRGYLLPRLVRLLRLWPGILLHGAIWGVWHAPLIYLIGYNYPGHPVIGIPMFVVFGMLAGILLAWLHLRSGSVFSPTIAHASLNATAGFPFLLLADVDPAVAGAIHSPVGWFVLIAAIVLVVNRGGLRLPGIQPEPLGEAS